MFYGLYLVLLPSSNKCPQVRLKSITYMGMEGVLICNFRIVHLVASYWEYSCTMLAPLTFTMLVWQIPVILNAFGGILVGLVTQYSGGIKKVLCWIAFSLEVSVCNCRTIAVFNIILYIYIYIYIYFLLFIYYFSKFSNTPVSKNTLQTFRCYTKDNANL